MIIQTLIGIGFAAIAYMLYMQQRINSADKEVILMIAGEMDKLAKRVSDIEAKS